MYKFNWRGFDEYRQRLDTVAERLSARDIHLLDRYTSKLIRFYQQQGIDPHDPEVAKVILLTAHLVVYEQVSLQDSIPEYSTPQIDRFLSTSNRVFGLFIRELLKSVEEAN